MLFLTAARNSQIFVPIMRFKIFTDPFYHSDDYVDFSPDEVIKIEQNVLTLFMRGKYKVTNITLKSGADYALEGDVAAEIEMAQAQSRHRSNA